MRHHTLAVTIGILTGITLTIAIPNLYRTRFGKHLTRWIFHTDARRTHGHLYSWKALA